MKKIILSALLSACMLFPACSDFLDVSDELASNLTLEETFAEFNLQMQQNSD